MDVVYDPTCLEHYGVGHDKGGHSGRYPWGSGAKKKYVKQVQKIKSRNREFSNKTTSASQYIASPVSKIQKLPGTSSLVNTPEIITAHSKMRQARDDYSTFIEEVDRKMHGDVEWLNEKVNWLRDHGVDEELSEIEVYFDSGVGSTIFDDYLKTHPDLQNAEIKKWRAQTLAESEFSQEIAKQFEDVQISKLTFSDGDVHFYGLASIQQAVEKTLYEIVEKDHLDETLHSKDKKGGKA